MAMKILVALEIDTDDKYCGKLCRWLPVNLDICTLFAQKIERCLGGGPLRCVKCVLSVPAPKPPTLLNEMMGTGEDME